MANVKISALIAYTDPSSSDILPIVDLVNDVTKKVTIADLLKNAGDGSAAAPAFAFNSDSNTGIYRSGADELSFATGGTQRLVISSSGVVSVNGNTVLTGGEANSVTSAMIVDGTIVNADVNASAAIAGTKVSPDFGSQAITTTGIINANGKVSFPLGSAAAPSLLPGSDTNTGIFSPGADSLAITTAGTQRVTVNSSGNVGIGSSSPASKLDVKRTDAAGNYFYAGASSDNGIRGLQFSSSNNGVYLGAAHKIDATSSGGSIALAIGGTERLRIKSDGTLHAIKSGSLIANAEQTVAVFQRSSSAGSTSKVSIVSGNAASSHINFGDTDDEDIGQLVYDHSNNSMQFRTAATERLRIDSSGNVGIGVSPFTSGRVNAPHLVVGSGSNSPGLTLYGAANAQASLNFGDATSGTAAYDGGLRYAFGSGSPYLSFHVNGAAERLRIDSSGRLLLGLSSSIGGNALLQVQGSGNRKAHFHQPDTGSCFTQFTNTTTGSGTGDGVLIGLEGDESLLISQKENNDIQIHTNNIERMRIDSSGRLLLNGTTATGDNKLQVISSDASINSLTIGRGTGNVSSNVAIGYQVLYLNTTGNSNTAAGYQALKENTTGSSNVASGWNCMSGNTTGYENSAFGRDSLKANTSGLQNIAGGMSSLRYNTTGIQNSAYGYRSLFSNTTGSKNIGIGCTAGDGITTGSNNTIIGDIPGTSTLSDTVIIGAGTAERLRIDSSGKVGVGIAAPSTELHVVNPATTAAVTLQASGGQYSAIYLADSSVGTGLYAGYIQYYHTNDSLQFGTASTERMRIDSLGNVGIGTTLPGGNKLRVLQPIGDQSGGAAIKAVGTAYGTNKAIHAYIASINANRSLIYAENQNGVVMNVNAAGNVGIGTSSPSSPLHVSATNNSGWIAQLVNTGTGTDANGLLVQASDSSTEYAFKIAQDDGTALLAVKGNGLVGIGTTSPQSEVHIATAGTGSAFYHATNGSTGANGNDGVSVGVSGTSGYLWNYESAPFIFGTGNNERMRIDSSGKVGIGTASPASKLHVRGGSLTVEHGSPSTGTGQFNINSESNSQVTFSYDDQGHISFGTASTPATQAGFSEKMRIDSSGNVLIGTGSYNNTVKGVQFNQSGQAFIIAQDNPALQVNRLGGDGTVVSIRNDSSQVGTITVSGSATAYNTSSDYRLKENVVDIADGITRVKQLSPKRFNFIADGDTTVDGFIAHEAQAVVPESVAGEKDGDEMQGIDQSKLVPLLTAALQEAIAKIETLEQRLLDADIA